MIAWNPNRQGWCPRGGLPGQVGVCEHPDNGQLNHLSYWVCFNQHLSTKAPVQHYQLQLLIEAWHMMGRDGVSQKAIHDVFMAIPEYRSMMSSDFKMLDQLDAVAQLITSFQSMLAALEHIVSKFDAGRNVEGHCICDARAAIENAKGCGVTANFSTL